MGVPGFFGWLLKQKKFNKIITNNINDKVDIFYIDANCLFHPQCFKVLNYYDESVSLDKIESKMIKRILNYIDYLIGLVNPQKEVFISVDGVAPMSKINQQRKRRYKTVYDNNLRNIIKKKHEKDTNDLWSNTSITPGTKFMEKLHNKLVDYVKTNRLKLQITYNYSSYHSVGEGEHKILQNIKKRDDGNVYMIYGLDADLIFLALASRKQKIYLLREETFFGKKETTKNDTIDIVTDVAEDLNYVSIDETKKNINELMNMMINKNSENEMMHEQFLDSVNDYTNDFIILCYFLGNDFLPNIPSIDIKNEGIDLLLKIFAETFLTLNDGLTYVENEKIKVNNVFLDMFISKISNYENYYFQVKYPDFTVRGSKRKCLSDDPYDKDIWMLENMKSFEINDPIKLGFDSSDLWKFRYYEHYYGANINQEEHINKMCEEYLFGMKWIMEYYFDGCPSMTWQYPYYHAPFISDLSHFLKETKFDINKVIFSKDQISLDPLTQLLVVLPPSQKALLPSSYGKLMSDRDSPILDIFPIEIHLDMLYKDSFHKCIPLIPNIEIDRIMKAIENIVFTNEEKDRNKITPNLVINY